MKKRFLILCSFIFIFAVVLGISYKNNTGIFENEDCYTKAQAAKMFTLLVESQDNIEEAIVTEKYSDLKPEKWYGKYVSEAVRLGFLKGNSQTGKLEPESAFTYKDAGNLLEQLDLPEKQFGFSLTSSKAMKREEVNAIYDAWILQYGEKSKVQKKAVYIYECNAEDERLVTNEGRLKLTGMDLSEYVGKCVILYCQNQICVALHSEYEESVTLANVWCESSDRNGIRIYSQNLESRLSGDFSNGEKYENVVADVTMKQNRIEKVQVKKDTVSGKVLSVSEEQIEMKEAGTYTFQEDMPIYRVYDTLCQESAVNLLLGYEKVTLVLEKNCVVAVLLTEALRTQNIRVLLNTSGFASQFHDTVKITCNQDYTVSVGGETKNYAAGKNVTFRKKSKLLQKGRVVVKPAAADGVLTITSIERGYGNPSYHGSLELSLYPEGICVVNDTGLEQYLYAVVPSEMPVSYGAEALKVQAVCARSYAYSQILNSSYSAYGAHLDDSVKSQVFNNSKECQESIDAVDSTCGQVLFDKENVASTYFFSTSCGHTAKSGDVWLNSHSTPDYLTGSLQAEGKNTLHLSSEEAFQEFIDTPDAYDFYEKDVNWFRWTVTMSREQVQEAVDANLANVLKYIKVKNKKGKYVSREIDTIGKIKDIRVQLRGDSGVIKQLVIQGSKAEIQVSSEFAVRKLLGNSKVAITLRDGSRSNQAMLPSGYFYISKTGNGENSQYSFNGGGYGHGVGMSQNGVKGMGDRGYSFEQILTHFFPNTQLKNIY